MRVPNPASTPAGASLDPAPEATPRRLRRRPSGDPPPLPKPAWWPRYVVLLIVTVALGVLIGWWYEASASTPDSAVMRWLAEHRTDWVTDVARFFSRLARQPSILVMRIALLVILVVYKRWRHLAVALLSFLLMDLLVVRLSTELTAPPDVLVPPGSGVYHFPAFAIASLSITLWAMVVTLAPAGKSRDAASLAAIVLGVLVVLARAYLGTTYPLAGLYSLLLGSCIAATLALAHSSMMLMYRANRASPQKNGFGPSGSVRRRSIHARVSPRVPGWPLNKATAFCFLATSSASPNAPRD